VLLKLIFEGKTGVSKRQKVRNMITNKNFDVTEDRIEDSWYVNVRSMHNK
jgi:hypothetical protein